MEIQESAPPVSHDDIKTSEIILGFCYPQDFISFYLKSNGGSPIQKVHIDSSGYESSIEWFLPIKYQEPVESIENTTLRLREKGFINNKEIIFAEDAGGNKFVLKEDESISYFVFDSGSDIRNNSRIIDHKFSDFVSKLITEEDAGF